MAIKLKEYIDKFRAMEKVANETLAADPEALVGVDSLPGSEHDAKVPEEAKKPDAEVTQGQPEGATSASGAVNGGDAKPLNEGKLELDEPLLNPEKKPLITDDALTAKTANQHLTSLVSELLSDIQSKPKEKSAMQKNKIEIDADTISKLAAAQAAFNNGQKAADAAIKQAQAAVKEDDFSPAVARKLIKEACIKAAQEQGLDPAQAEAAAENAMAIAGAAPEVPAAGAAPEAAAADAPAAGADDAAAAAEMIPEDVTEEELANAIVDLVSSGELDPDTAKAIVEEIAGDEASGPSEDQAAEIIAQGIQSGEISMEQAKEIADAIDGGAGAAETADAAAGAADAEAAAQDAADEAQGAADADAAIQEAVDEAQGAADAEAAIKDAAAHVRSDAINKVASAVVANRQKADAPQKGSKIMNKVASILQSKEASAKAQEQYIAGFKKKASELGVDPAALAQYIIANQPQSK